MSRRLEQGTDLRQSLSDIRGAIHVLYPKNIDKLSQWQSHNLGPQVSERDPLGVAWFIDMEINNTSAINFLGASNTNGRVVLMHSSSFHVVWPLTRWMSIDSGIQIDCCQ